MIETDKLAAERVIAATPTSPNEEAFERALLMLAQTHDDLARGSAAGDLSLCGVACR